MTRLQRLKTEARARCPDCGIPTVPDHQELTHEARLCEACYLRWSEEDGPYDPTRAGGIFEPLEEGDA